MRFLGAVLAELFPRTTRTHTQLATLALMLLFSGILGTSAVAVASSPACEQLVRTYVDRVVRNVVSPATLRSWREWGVKHPHWHPTLNAAARPKYKKVHELKIGKMQLACPIITDEIALLPAALDNFFLPTPAPAFEEALNTPASAPIQAFQAPLGSTPAGIFGGGGGGAIGSGGIGGGGGGVGGGSIPTGTPVSTTPVSTPVPITPAEPAIPAPVPEPSSVLLTLTGMSAVGAFCFFRRKPTMTAFSA